MSALRNNAGKPQLDYLFTFEEGIAETFQGSELLPGLRELQLWYTQPHGKGLVTLRSAAGYILAQLPSDWPEQLADTCERGAAKYARGNYLLGMSWSFVLACLLRHERKRMKGETCDAEGFSHVGAIAWNTHYLVHMVVNDLGTDDRVRAPKAEAPGKPRECGCGCRPTECEIGCTSKCGCPAFEARKAAK